MTPLSESVLAERLRQTAESFTPPPGLEATILDSVSTSRWHSRSRSIALLAVAACVAAALVVGVSIISGRVQSAPPADQITPTPSPSSSPSPSPSQTKEAAPKGPPVFKWAQGLPRGDDARAVFDVGGVLYVGDQTYSIPAVPKYASAVYAATPEGWLVSWHKCASGPLCGLSVHGLLSPDGSVTEFPYPRTGAETYAVSPDGESVIFDRWILDTYTGEVIADLPKNMGYINAWTPQGVVYFDGGPANRQWWWQPGREPIQIQEAPDYRSDGLGIDSTRGCSTVQRLREGGIGQVLMTRCGGDYLSDLSPSGTRAVTESGLIVDVPSGREVGSLNVPDNFASEFYPTSMLWENATNILYVVEDYQATFRVPMVIVRCNVTSGECQRASDTLSDYTSQLHLVPLDPAAPRDGTT